MAKMRKNANNSMPALSHFSGLLWVTNSMKNTKIRRIILYIWALRRINFYTGGEKNAFDLFHLNLSRNFKDRFFVVVRFKRSLSQRETHTHSFQYQIWNWSLTFACYSQKKQIANAPKKESVKLMDNSIHNIKQLNSQMLKRTAINIVSLFDKWII